MLRVLIVALCLADVAWADPIVVRHREGVSHGFLVLSSLDRKTLAYGDLFQVAAGDQVTTETVFHFKDGSLYDDTAVFLQDQKFQLISDHLVQKGPSFPHAIDMVIDVAHKAVTVHASDKGKEKNTSEHMDFPEDISNGMVLVLLRNISPSSSQTKVSMLAMSSKPRLVHLVIAPIGERAFAFAGASRKATDFDVKVEIGGVAGVLAPLVGKQPPDTHIWMSTGVSPTFVQSEGPLYEGGPIWRTSLAPLEVMDHDQETKTEGKEKR